MQRILFFICFIAFNIGKLAAQPSFSFSPSNPVVNQNQEICITLKVDDFTDILGARFPIKWNPGVLQFKRIQSLNGNVPQLDLADFDLSLVTNGELKFNWTNGLDCRTATSSVTLPDESEFFQICFQAVGIYGNHTFIEIPAGLFDNYVTRLNSNCNNIGMIAETGFVSIETPPIKVNISNGDGFKDDVVCVDFKVEDFNKIIAFQFPIIWDSTVLEFHSASTFGLPQWSASNNIGTSKASSGLLTVSWLKISADGKGETLSNGTRILQLCFKVKGSCGQSSDIKIEANPLSPVEVYNEISGTSTIGTHIGLLQQKGKVSVNCQNPDNITLTIDDKNVCPGEIFEVDLRVRDFRNINKLQFSLIWNPGVIELIDPKVTFPGSGSPCIGFENLSSTIKINQAGNGLITVDYQRSGFGCSQADDRIIMRLHFKAIGPEGSNTNIAIVNPILVRKQFDSNDYGINNNNGLISLCELQGLSMTASATVGNPNDTVCISFSTYDFTNITRMEYTINWEPNVLQFLYLKDFDLPNLSSLNFNQSLAQALGVIGVSWQNVTGVTKTSGSSLFKACYRVIGDPGECSDIRFESEPYPINIVTSTSNGTNVGMTGQPGNVCISNPLAFITGFNHVFAGSNSRICLDVKVQNFRQLTHMKYSVNWNSSLLKYAGVIPTGALPDFNAFSYNADTSLTNHGQLVIDWNTANPVGGTTVADGTVIYRLCFDVIGSPEKCSPVTITGIPSLIDVASAPTGNSNLGLTASEGSVCISGMLTLVNSSVSEIDCPSIKDGKITMTVSGGSGVYDYAWTGPGVVQNTNIQNNLGVGKYEVTVTDKANPGISLTKDFEIKYSVKAPLANAGPDTARQCNSFTIVLNGTRSARGADFSYRWTSITGGGLVVEPDSIKPLVIGGACFELKVTNNLTGCFMKDTVCVVAPIAPNVNAGPDQSITCLVDTVTLDGSRSSSNFDIQWTAGPGAKLVPGSENTLKVKAVAEGWYYLRLSNESTGCFGVDSVFVSLNKAKPIADAGTDKKISCSESFAILDGSKSSSGDNKYTYLWTALDGGSICDVANTISSKACTKGSYQLLVRDTTSGCFSFDTVSISTDTLKPVISVGPDKVLNCLNTQDTLVATVFTTGNYTYSWSPSAGIVSGQGTSKIIVNQAGQYTFVVEDRTNGCNANATITVTKSVTNPIAVATVNRPITCNNIDATLSSEGSSRGAAISYQWKNSSGITVSNAPDFNVTSPGNYSLLVTDTGNSCTSTASVSVTSQTQKPAAFAGRDTVIGCVPASIILEGTTDVGVPGLVVQWSGPPGICLKNGSSLKPEVSCSGQYIMTVFNTQTGCVNRDTVVVVNDKTPPLVDAGIDTSLTCTRTAVNLKGNTNLAPAQATVSWVSIPANLPISNATSLTPTINQAGNYFLTVVSKTNGCSKTDNIVVSLDNVNPIANAGLDDSITCLKVMGTLSAKASTLANTTLTWSALSGSLSPAQANQVDISVPIGVYQLRVLNTGNGCFALDTASVIDRRQLPMADVGADPVVGCAADTVTVIAGGPVDASLSYLWKDSTGKIVGNGKSLLILKLGEYTLTVANSASGCQAIDTFVVSRRIDAPPAIAQIDYDACLPDAVLIGNLPPGANGGWTTTGTATIQNAFSSGASARNLAFGINTFIWTLSKGNCVAYSSDTAEVLVNRRKPGAVDDQVRLIKGQGDQITLNVMQNDQLFSQMVTFKVLQQPGVGKLTSSANGDLQYVREKCQDGVINISYQICSENCPLMCDTGNVAITLEEDSSPGCTTPPNAITPNGDGLNDELVFNVLANNSSSEYPDNELIIFNRWGDIVFKARPYQNDWKGTNSAGKELPHGTYYYILRLNIASGEILRGDVTILR
jgi:gliding motility-associated-like protein